jgi:aspartate racemase
VPLPLIHIADPLREALARDRRNRPLLLGTRFTMEHDYIRAPLAEAGIAAEIPDERERATIHGVIYDELIRGVTTPASREAFIAIISAGREAGADGVILGCTEIPLLIRPEDLPGLPRFDTMALHVAAAIDWALDTADRTGTAASKMDS